MGVSPWVHDNAAFMIFTQLDTAGGVEELFTNVGSLYPITDLNAKVETSELVKKIRFVKAACKLDRRGGYLGQRSVELGFCLCMNKNSRARRTCQASLGSATFDSRIDHHYSSISVPSTPL